MGEGPQPPKVRLLDESWRIAGQVSQVSAAGERNSGGWQETGSL